MIRSLLVITFLVAALAGCTDGRLDFSKVQEQSRTTATWLDDNRDNYERAKSYERSVDFDKLEERVDQIPGLDSEAAAKVRREAEKARDAVEAIAAYEERYDAYQGLQAVMAEFGDERHTEPHEAIAGALSAATPFAGPYAGLVGIATTVVSLVGGWLAGRKKEKKRAAKVVNALEKARVTGGGDIKLSDPLVAANVKADMGPEGRSLVNELKPV